MSAGCRRAGDPAGSAGARPTVGRRPATIPASAQAEAPGHPRDSPPALGIKEHLPLPVLPVRAIEPRAIHCPRSRGKSTPQASSNLIRRIFYKHLRPGHKASPRYPSDRTNRIRSLTDSGPGACYPARRIIVREPLPGHEPRAPSAHSWIPVACSKLGLNSLFPVPVIYPNIG